MDYALEIKDLTKRYGDFCLDGIDLAVPKGSIVGFIGDNGAGKTTTMRLILGLAARDGGTITVLGMDTLKEERAIKQQLGVVFDECFFHETLRAPDVAKIMRHFYDAWDDSLFLELLKRFGLPQEKTIKDFSRGMKMKLSLAAALAHHPKLLLLDEATSGLDPVVRSELLDLFMEFIQDEEHSILLSSHITSDLEKICDYICFLHQGEIVLSGPKDSLLDRFGILRCGAAELETLPANLLLRVRRNSFGCEALVSDRAAAARRVPDAVLDRATLEDIMLFYVKGEIA